MISLSLMKLKEKGLFKVGCPEWGKVFTFLGSFFYVLTNGCYSPDLVTSKAFESYLNYVLFVVTVLCYSVMNMKYFRYISIIDEYVKKRAEKFDSATIMKMKWRELPVPLAVDETVCRSRHFVRDRHIWNNCFCNLTLTKWEFVIDTFSHNFSCCSCGLQVSSTRRLRLRRCSLCPKSFHGGTLFLFCCYIRSFVPLTSK
jgi:hypothetical protein